MAEVSGKVANAVVKVQVQNQDKIGAANATLAKTGGLLSQVGHAAGEAGSATMNAFGQIQNSIENAGQAALKFVGSMAMIGTGAAVGGLSWLGAEQFKLYSEEVYRAIDANKKLGLTSEQLKSHVQKMVTEAPSWMTEEQATAAMYSAMAVGGKYLGKGEKGLGKAEDIAKFFERNKELIQAPIEKGGMGIGSFEQLMRIASREGKLRPDMAMSLKVLGLTDAQLETPKRRIKALAELGKGINIKFEVDKRPWDQVSINIDTLQHKIGTAMGSTLLPFTQRIADLVTEISEIPAAPGLIGMAGIAIAGAGALSLLIGVFTPLLSLLPIAAVATKAWAAAQWLLNAAMSANPLGIAIIALAGLAALLYLVEQKTHFFSNAWKDISKTAFVQGLIAQFSSLVGWISQGAAGLAKLGGGGALKMVLAMAVGPAFLLLKPVLMIADFLYKIFTRIDALKKLFEMLAGVWTNIWSAISWIADFLKGLIDKVRSFLPSWAGGYSEEEKTKKALKKEGVNPGEAVTGINKLSDLGAIEWQQYGEGGGAWVARPGWNVKYGPGGEPTEGTYTPPSETPSSGAGPAAPPIPTGEFNPDLFYKGKESGLIIKGSVLSAAGFTRDKYEDKTYLDSSGRSPYAPPAASVLPTGDGGGDGGDRGNAPSGYTESEYQKTSDELDLAGWSSMSAQGGATFPRGGLFFGKVHPSEEIVPQAIAQRGPGPISKAIEALSGLRLGAGGGGIGPISVTNNINVNKIDKESDIDRLIAKMSDQAADQLIFRLQNRLSSKQQREIAYMRG